MDGVVHTLEDRRENEQVTKAPILNGRNNLAVSSE